MRGGRRSRLTRAAPEARFKNYKSAGRKRFFRLLSGARMSSASLPKSEENLFKGLIERNLPPSLQWRSQPFKWSFDREGKLIIVAGT